MPPQFQCAHEQLQGDQYDQLDADGRQPTTQFIDDRDPADIRQAGPPGQMGGADERTDDKKTTV